MIRDNVGKVTFSPNADCSTVWPPGVNPYGKVWISTIVKVTGQCSPTHWGVSYV